MALTNTTNYVGTAAKEYISQALFAGESFEKGLIFPVTNVKYKIALPRMDISTNLIQPDSQNWTSGGTLVRTEKYLIPVRLKVNFEHWKNAFQDSYESERSPAGALANEAPSDVYTYINDLMVASIGQQVEIAVWSSNWSGASPTSLSAYTITGFNGLLKKIDEDSPTRVVGTTLSASNIQAELAKVYNAIPSQLLNKTVIGLSKTALGYYKQSLAAQASIGDASKDQADTYLGVKLYGLAGYPTNVMCSFVPANQPNRACFMGTDLEADFQEIKIIDQSNYTGDDIIKYKMRFQGDTNVAIGAECVLYK